MLKSLPFRLACSARRLGAAAFGRRWLVATNVGLSVGLSGLGDFVQQSSRGAGNHVDTTRLRRMAAAGLPCGLICHYWYIWLDAFLPGRGALVVAKKVVWDQLALSPLMWLCYFAFLGALEGNTSLNHLQSRVWHLGGRLYAAEWLVWPPAQALNFYFLPTKFRVLYDNVVSLGFDVYASHLVHDRAIEPTEL